MRTIFSKAIVDAALNDERVLLLTGDHGYALFDEFRKAAPRQFINAGVAEQNMVGMAAGLAKAGFRPIVYGLSAFVPVRVLEQIKLDVCYEGLPVVFMGDGAGVVYSSLGSSHQSVEDIAALRAIPHIDILSPGDRAEMAYAMAHALSFKRPVYVRMGKADLAEAHRPGAFEPNAPLGTLICLAGEQGASLAFVATGSMLGSAMTLAEEYGDSVVWSVPSIRPIDEDQVRTIARTARTIVVLEEHSSEGGLGGLVAELVAEMDGNRARVIRLGTEGKFSELCGSYAYLLKEHGLDLPGLRRRMEKKGLTREQR
ncbi:transketolase C-terminal domain-containing protein [Achromobacter denitrificans]|uniref:transketolase family protein n=1 Tax=Achromobacter denitrificans TaxID=32002 RepID=UPI000B49499D|nr:transketolase C-terminal domain-containing protein [Achromobacter denitrificans]MDF3942661.1 transketolase C-terminal domain-containing protein [Achromobacter denitrificans]